MRSIFAIVLVYVISLPLAAEDLVLVNGSVIDGSGKPRLAANIRIHDGKIKDIGPFKPAANEALLDVKGLIVAPGLYRVSNVIAGGDREGSCCRRSALARRDHRGPRR